MQGRQAGQPKEMLTFNGIAESSPCRETHCALNSSRQSWPSGYATLMLELSTSRLLIPEILLNPGIRAEFIP